jgi:hypothetical protein
MAAPKKNNFWMLRSKHGRDMIFSSPSVLMEECYGYFSHCDKNPWYKSEAIKSGEKTGKIIKVPTQRPYTLTGLFIYLDINRSTWDLYRDREDFIAVITHIEEIIYTQKFEGAVVGAFNANIIARDLGLADTNKTELSGKGGGPIPIESKHIVEFHDYTTGD